MEDLYFENELKNRERKKIERNFDNYKVYFGLGNEISRTTKEVFQNFEDVLDFYDYDTKDYNEINEKFKQQLTDDALLSRYNKHIFSQEEMEFIKLVHVSSKWRGDWLYNVDAQYAIIDILIREIIIEQFGNDSLQTFRDIIQNTLRKTERNTPTIEHYMELLSDKPYGDNLHDKLESCIEEDTLRSFNQQINCGGYALKIDQCVFPTYQENFSKSVSSLLEKFPFVRLLGHTPLEDDEYLVIYRAPQGKNTGHHFIRVDSDGTVKEKDGCAEPRIFENWGVLENGMEALFAVKKEHKMFGYRLYDVNTGHKGLDFEESVEKSIREKQNLFSYHNHSFCLKKSKQDEIFVTTIDGEVVAEVLVDEDDCLVEVIESKREYVENTSGVMAPIISNGKLVNFEQYKAKDIDTIDNKAYKKVYQSKGASGVDGITVEEVLDI